MGEIGGKPADAVAVLYGRYQSALLHVAAGYAGSFRHESRP